MRFSPNYCLIELFSNFVFTGKRSDVYRNWYGVKIAQDGGMHSNGNKFDKFRSKCAQI